MADGGAGRDGSTPPDGGSPEAGATTAHTLFVAVGDTLVAFDVATGTSKTGAVANVKGPTDLQALDTGHLAVNLTDLNEILFVDARTMQETARVKSSDMGGTRPVHGYITPRIGGKQYWVANNDGAPGMAATNSLRFVDITPGSATFLKAVGEIGLGIGHHKNAFSPSKARVSVSNIADCSNVLQVIDYGTASAPMLVKKWSAAELDPARDCAMQGAGPHGSAAGSNGRGYHNLTGWGAIASVHQDADPPTVKLLPTMGNGAGYTKAGKDGRYVYSLQRTPREGDMAKPGKDCQIGNLVVIDSMTDTIAAEVPLLYTGPACTSKLPGTAVRAGPDNIQISADGKTMFVATNASPPTGSMEQHFADQHLVVDLANPAQPVQKESIKIGSHSGHRSQRVSGDGKWLFVLNNNDKTISQIDAQSRAVTRTIPVGDVPRQIATFGTAEGPSVQIGPH
jgi:YVTN family beta-propeller protein